MLENKNNWQAGVRVFTEISGWIVAPIVLALVVGKSLDARYGTAPWIFLIFAGAGFLITLFGMVRIVQKYMREIQKSPDGKTVEDPRWQSHREK